MISQLLKKMVWCFVLISSITPSISQNIVVQPCFKCATKLESPYGILSNITRSDRDYNIRDLNLKIIENAGIENVRTDYESGNCINYKNNGTFIPQKFDSVLNSCNNYRLNIFPIIDWEYKGKFGWDNTKNYLNYIQDLVHRYHKYIHYWEIMNEVNLMGINNKDSLADLYVNTLKEIYKLIKKEDINNQVLLSGLSGTKDNFLEKICRRGVYKYFDIMNFHSYDSPEKLPQSFKYIRNEMDKYKWNKPVWITETGYTTVLWPEEIGKRTIHDNETIQAERLPRAYLISFAYGIDKVFWYHLHALERSITDPESHYGILHKDYSPKPAYNAYKTLTIMCPNNSTRPSLEINDGMYISQWERPNGTKVEAIWSISGKKKIQLNIPPNTKCYNYMGESVNINNDMYADSGILYFVKESKK